MADQRVDILLALRTTLAGNTEALAQLDRLKTSTGHVADEWDHLGKKLERKFSLPDIGYDLLKGVGAGGGFALVEKASELISTWWHQAAEEAKDFQDYIAKTADDLKTLHNLRFGNLLATLLPEEQLKLKQKQLADIGKTIAEQERRQAAGTALVALAGTANVNPLSDSGPKSFILDKKAYTPRELGEEGFKRQEDARLKAKAASEDYQKVLSEIRALQEGPINKALSEFFTSLDQLSANTREVTAKNLEATLASAKKFGRDMAAWKEITPEDQARATEELRKFTEETEKLAASTAIRAATTEVTAFDVALEKLDRNPALTDQEKYTQRVKILNDQTAAIARLKAELEAFAAAHPDIEVAAMTGQIASLGKKAAENEGRIQPPQTLAQRDTNALADFSDPSKHYQSAGGGALGGIRAELASLGTVGDRVGKTLQQSLGGAFDSVGQNLSGLILGTENWHQALGNIYNTIATDLVQGIVKMFTSWIEQRALAALAGMAWSAEEGAADTAAKAPGAVLSSISSFGVAALVGVAAIVAAMAAFGGFESGGYTGNIDTSSIAGVVHGREYVFDAASTARLGPDFLSALRFAPDPMAVLASTANQPASSGRSSSGSSSSSAFSSSAGKPHQILVLNQSDRGGIAQARRNPAFRTQNVKVQQANGRVITLPA